MVSEDAWAWHQWHKLHDPPRQPDGTCRVCGAVADLDEPGGQCEECYEGRTLFAVAVFQRRKRGKVVATVDVWCEQDDRYARRIITRRTEDLLWYDIRPALELRGVNTSGMDLEREHALGWARQKAQQWGAVLVSFWPGGTERG